MIKLITCAILLLIFTSCSTYQMLEGKSRPVFFSPDSSVFNDPDFPQPSITYADLLNIRGYSPNVVELKKGETAKAILYQPTFFIAYDNFLIYPGEHIGIKKAEYNEYTFFKVNGNKRRNRELLFFKAFHKIDQYPAIPNIDNAPLDIILNLEQQLKSEIPKIALASRLRFDSLINACHVSRKFNKLSQGYLKNRYDISVFFLYKKYKDSLQAHDLFKDKCNQLIPLFNDITKRSEFDNTQILFNELVDIVLPYKISKINNEDEFQSCFNAVLNKFNALARDYLLSRLIYYANIKRIQVSPGYMEKYETVCYDKTYKNLVHDVISQQQENDTKASGISNNSLLSVDGKKISGLEDVLVKYKGELILIDFWATWCLPCRVEMPYLKKIIQEYSGNKITFLTVSIDREIQPWRKAIITSNTDVNKNYLLLNPEKSPFAQQNNINSIPRYVLINKDGKIIDADAPRPSDPKLKELLNKYLQE